MSLMRARKRLARQNQSQIPFQPIGRSVKARMDKVLIDDRLVPECVVFPAPLQEELAALCTDMSEVVGGSTVASAGYLGSTLVRYITNIFMARMVSPGVYGMFGEIYSLTYILGWMAKLGFDVVFVRLLPSYRLQKAPELMVGLARFILWITIILGLLISLLFFVWTPRIALLFYHDTSCLLLLQETSLLIPLIALQTVITAGLQAFKEVLWKMCVERLVQPILTLLVLVVVFLLGWKMEGLSFSTIAGYAFSVLIGQFVLTKIIKQHTSRVRARYQARLWMALTLPMFFNGLVYALADTVNAILLGFLAMPSQAAGYLIAERAAMFVTMPMAALSVRYTPLIAEYYYHGLLTRIQQMYIAVTRWSVSLSLPIFLWFLVFRQSVLEGFGAEYVGYENVLIIVCIGFLVYAVLGPASYIFAMVGPPRLIMINSTLSIGANIALSFILILHYGALGAALGVFFSAIITYGMSFCWVSWRLKMQPFRWELYKPLVAGGIASLIGSLLLQCIQYETAGFRWLEILVAMVLFFCIYCYTLVLLRFCPEDLFVFARLFGKFGLRPLT
ncbi:oligosaccharide flippase family protein [Dictyobacter kobayashii]|uniref:Uncharacterized protein n=1 Tax=Dictyobacter kobayashii TaxID=2014872 RepID=A0A402AUV2_9CHLR|nr:oligosaccharide flippase family protein [Dictyobacter kobayashii]GCE22910.1 hypothetical protein KDK_67100 [Dictyobacter kobayashii]